MSEEERKKDDLADALAALAAGEHPDEPVEGSGIDAHTHLEGVGETPSPPRTPAGLTKPPAARPAQSAQAPRSDPPRRLPRRTTPKSAPRRTRLPTSWRTMTR